MYIGAALPKKSSGDQFRVGRRKTGGGDSDSGNGGGKSSGLMKYLPWAAGALGLVVVVAVVSSGGKKTESRAAA